eukprot:2828946-Prorocentrum_lima.AAC.1
MKTGFSRVFVAVGARDLSGLSVTVNACVKEDAYRRNQRATRWRRTTRTTNITTAAATATKNRYDDEKKG